MPEMPLRQPRFTYNACGPFTKNKEYKKVEETGFKIYSSKRTSLLTATFYWFHEFEDL